MRSLAEIVHLRTASCKEAAEAVVHIAAGEAEADPARAEHVRTCLRCQAEVAAYRRVLGAMRAMRHDILEPSEGVEEAVADLLRRLGAMAPEGPPPSWTVRVAYVGGLTAASAAGVLVWFTRRRPSLARAG